MKIDFFNEMFLSNVQVKPCFVISAHQFGLNSIGKYELGLTLIT